MTKKQGRPLGTTSKNGVKVAVDSAKYWETRLGTIRGRKVFSSIKLEDKKVYDRLVELFDDKPVHDFMDKVARGLKVFLSPYNR